MPQVLSAVVIGIIWNWIYNPMFGILNKLLDAVGLEEVSRGWLGDPDFALYAVLVAAIWATIGFVFVIFLAGLQNVSKDLLEAATIDGANTLAAFLGCHRAPAQQRHQRRRRRSSSSAASTSSTSSSS